MLRRRRVGGVRGCCGSGKSAIGGDAAARGETPSLPPDLALGKLASAAQRRKGMQRRRFGGVRGGGVSDGPGGGALPSAKSGGRGDGSVGRGYDGSGRGGSGGPTAQQRQRRCRGNGALLSIRRRQRRWRRQWRQWRWW
ncbi:hypothetical protein OsJ_23891 [Oryza sativa Japonica Group]|uniref:Uncharacterized protein n=1 Tax=Oryza sativa subsp. japonica TaxID=39947 RepID=A3BIS4_ORYSJ|nr:hypothetical protein OsJ_23891 [Oryza sativa Japonica Group]